MILYILAGFKIRFRWEGTVPWHLWEYIQIIYIFIDFLYTKRIDPK